MATAPYIPSPFTHSLTHASVDYFAPARSLFIYLLFRIMNACTSFNKTEWQRKYQWNPNAKKSFQLREQCNKQKIIDAYVYAVCAMHIPWIRNISGECVCVCVLCMCSFIPFFHYTLDSFFSFSLALFHSMVCVVMTFLCLTTKFAHKHYYSISLHLLKKQLNAIRTTTSYLRCQCSNQFRNSNNIIDSTLFSSTKKKTQRSDCYWIRYWKSCCRITHTHTQTHTQKWYIKMK